jgi:hypothetical protein
MLGAEHCIYLYSISLRTTPSDHLILFQNITVTVFAHCEKYEAKYEYCAVLQASCQFLLFGPKYLFQYPVLEHRPLMVSP